MPQYIRGARDMVDRLRDAQRAAAETRQQMRGTLRRARQTARFDPVQVELLIDRIMPLLDALDDLDDQIRDLFADTILPKLQQRTKGEEVEESQIKQELADIQERLARVERSARLPLEEPERRPRS